VSDGSRAPPTGATHPKCTSLAAAKEGREHYHVGRLSPVLSSTMPVSSGDPYRANTDIVAHHPLLCSYDELNNRAGLPPHSSQTYLIVPNHHPPYNGSPATQPNRRRKKTSGHRGEAGFGSSVVNLANTILGAWQFLRVVALPR